MLAAPWSVPLLPFSLADADRTTFFRDDFNYNVYHDPGPPPRSKGTDSDIYKWAFALVAVWSGQLDQDDGVMIDISPASKGNAGELLGQPFRAVVKTFQVRVWNELRDAWRELAAEERAAIAALDASVRQLD